ncbi:MAG: cytochrome C peroxidase [Betaproteobacteria bacterium]|nr:cytochrome C peroxidase [Betaproteobacteria bacterium]
MNPRAKPLRAALAGVFAIGMGGPLAHAAAPCSPCSPRTRSNPSAEKKNPCAARNPCAAARSKVDPRLVTRPKGTKLATGERAELLQLGESLWKDTKLSTNGLSCNTCHQGGAAFQNTFANPYPHYVAMAKEQGGLKRINLDEMVQFCLVVPMATKPLGWDSKQLAALTAYTADLQKTFRPAQAGKSNPCAAKNPCAPKANPCAAK